MSFMEDKKFLSTTELAKILGISRIATYKKIKKGVIKASKVGHDFVIDKKGRKLAVQLPVKFYEKLIADSEEIEDIKAYRKLKHTKAIR